ncbi:28S ribosomal protein S7, mitochondrial [Teleopsis dalmanni]|uniref:28S ribosomal protein S7, mitochondrial n=1 Tax=Teleopsis dalmanni TaxID=139649 RepID=UPI0018CF7979|nr:28S ribosomal protein S7, mitochondrial [Teleopsis dalmanni]
MIRTILECKLFSSTNCLYRRMSVFPPGYVDSVMKNRQKELSPEELYKLNHTPTKPAKNDESDSIYYHPIVKKMVNYITKGGNKELARNLLEQSMENIKRMQLERFHIASADEKLKIITDPEKLLITAIENCRPILQLTAIKRGGVKYQVPIPVSEKTSYFLAMKWLLEAAREKDRKIHLPRKLAWEVIDAAHGTGRVVKRKNDLHIQCEKNRAYAHYRWS